jgi:transcriptional regulator with XRE-family HTH domain
MRIAKATETRVSHLYSEVGGRIKAARGRLALTQGELGARVGLTRTSVTNIEAGRQKLLLHTLYRMAEVLQVPVVDLLPELTRGTDDRTDVARALSGALTPAEQEWIVSVATAPAPAPET